MKRIIFINRFFHPDIAPTAQLLADVVEALAAAAPEGAGLEVYELHVVACRQAYTDPKADLPREGRFHSALVHRCRSTRFGRGSLAGRALDSLSFMLAANWRLLRLARQGDVVVAKTAPPLLSSLAALVCRLRGARLVNWVQDLFPDVAVSLGVIRPRGLAHRLLAALRDTALRQASMNVALGPRMAGRIAGCGVDPRRIHVRHNWVDSALVTPLDHADNPLRAAWGLTGRFVVGYSGNFGRVHEFETIMEAARLLAAAPGVCFLLVGRGARLQRLKVRVGELGLANIVFQDYQPRERLRESLAAADAHLVSLLPAMEGCVVPSKFYGVAAAGRPTLFVGDLDGEIARLLALHDCGLASRPGDAEALAAHIRHLAADPEEAARLGQNARAATDELYAKPLALADMCALLRRVAHASPGEAEMSAENGVAKGVST
ncbi:MAG: glycosyltransferase family 4 protein [Humidesulfovibrio sp.]|nr:glycosyltransferase family 4 protein [Humidesulfovibrio sp.]